MHYYDYPNYRGAIFQLLQFITIKKWDIRNPQKCYGFLKNYENVIEILPKITIHRIINSLLTKN